MRTAGKRSIAVTERSDRNPPQRHSQLDDMIEQDRTSFGSTALPNLGLIRIKATPLRGVADAAPADPGYS
jgi:hypothetical protein